VSGTPPRLGWYGDDFTGATDTLATVATAGLRTLLFLGVPSPEQLAAAGPLDAIGIAGASRTMDPAAMAVELEPVGRFFAGAGVRVLHYKCCSTFDSAPTIGSIGAAAAILQRFMPNPLVPIVGGQPNIGRYCVFSTLFAAAGAGGALHRIDRHPTMSIHPVTPMHEADLRLHLTAQGLGPIAALHYPSYAAGPAALTHMLDAIVATKPAALLLDVAASSDLPAIGRLIWNQALASPLLAIGPSSVAQALAAHWAGDAAAQPATEPETGKPVGPVLVLAGSLSPVTRGQIEAASSFEKVPLDAAQLADPVFRHEQAERIGARLGAGAHVLAYTQTGGVEAGSAAVAQGTADLLSDILALAPVRRVGIAGGDTSSQAVKKLGLWGLSYQATLAPGVSLCRGHSADPRLDGVELMLKGGQMGARTLFEKLTGSFAA
jgi:uncharacterized protein YgbK (DUF1537 family)